MSTGDYRNLCRKLAGVLRDIVVTKRPELVIGDGDYDRLFDRAEELLKRFEEYEQQRRKPKVGTDA